MSHHYSGVNLGFPHGDAFALVAEIEAATPRG